MTRGHSTVSFRPIVGYSVCKDGAIPVERGGADRARRSFERYETQG